MTRDNEPAAAQRTRLLAPADGSSQLPAVTLLGRLRAARGVSLFAVLALAALPLSGTALLQAERGLRASTLDLPFAQGLDLEETAGTRAELHGLRRGDRLVGFEGAPVASVDAFLALEAGLQPEALVNLSFARGRELVSVRVAARAPGLLEQAWLTARALTGIALLAIGLLTFLLRPGDRESWLFLLFCGALGVALLAVFALREHYALRNVVSLSCIPIAAALGIHLFLVFPRGFELIDRSRWIVLLPYVPALITVPAFVAMWGHPRGERGWLTPEVLVAASGVLGSGGLIALVVLHARSASRRGDPRLAAQARVLGLGVALGLLLPSALVVAWRLGLLSFPGVAHAVAVPVVAFAVATGFALVRHNLFDVDRFNAAVLGYGTAVAGVIAALTLGRFGIQWLLERLGLIASPLAATIGTALLALAIAPLQRRLRVALGRPFGRARLGAGRAAELLTELSLALRSCPLEAAPSRALDAASAVGVDQLEWWSNDGDLTLLRPVEGRGPAGHGQGGASRPAGAQPEERSLSAKSPLGIELLVLEKPRGLSSLAPETLSREAQAELWARGLALAVPVRAAGQLAGFLGLGRKVSGAAYSEDDSGYLAAVARALGQRLERGGDDAATVGNYRLLRRLGSGGMAEVHLAMQLGPGGFERPVAIKRPLPHLAEDPQCVAMFLDEARIAAQLSHRNIVSVLEVGRAEGRYFIAMELVDGFSLGNLLQRCRQARAAVPLDVVAAIAEGVASALGHAHAATSADGAPLTLVHRDVKPANVLVSRRGEVKLTDFGIASAARRLAATEPGFVKGTVTAMAPEQAAGESVDQRADVYSLAAMLFELLVFEPPFPLGRVLPEVPRLTERRPELRPALDTFFASALAFDPSDRPPSAQALLAGFLAALTEPPLRPATEAEVAAWVRHVQAPAGAPSPSASDAGTDTGSASPRAEAVGEAPTRVGEGTAETHLHR